MLILPIQAQNTVSMLPGVHFLKVAWILTAMFSVDFVFTGAITLGAMSPGQSFILVARTAVASSRRA